MNQTIYTNPFNQLAEALRSLHALYMRETGPDEVLRNPRVAEVLGGIIGLMNECEKLRAMVEELERTDPGAYQTFQRTLGKFGANEAIK
jgi:hypothetical protein